MKVENRKLFMVVNYTPADKSIGVTKKITGEIHAMRRLGIEVFYTAYHDEGICIFNNEDRIVWRHRFGMKHKYYISFIRRFSLIAEAKKYLKKETFDLGYLRYTGFDELFLSLLKQMKKKNMKVLIESLSYFPQQSFPGFDIKAIFVMYSAKLNEKKARKYIDLVLSEGGIKNVWGCRTLPVNMGVDLKNYKSHQYTGDRDELHLISVANETVYHAYDRLIRSLHHYYTNGGMYTIHIHLVGVMYDETIQLVNELRLSPYIHFYGKQFGEQLQIIYNKCNMGVGPLGQHRIGGKKDTGLKTKEYFAIGIPYIYSGKEKCLPPDYPYVYEVLADESILDFHKIIAFYHSYREDSKCIENMREFARVHFSWDRIMKEIFEAL